MKNQRKHQQKIEKKRRKQDKQQKREAEYQARPKLRRCGGCRECCCPPRPEASMSMVQARNAARLRHPRRSGTTGRVQGV